MQQWADKARPAVKRPRSLPSDTPAAEAVRSVQAAVEGEHATPIDLDGAMRERMEAHFGPGVSQVRLVQSDLPGQLGADAVAQGDLIRFAPGAFQPGTEAGERLLSHELGHVVQQGRGGAMGGAAGLPLYDSGAEAGADAIAAQAMDGGLSGGLQSFSPAPAAQAPMLGNAFTDFFKSLFGFDETPSRNGSEESIQDDPMSEAELDRMIDAAPWKRDASAPHPADNNLPGESDPFYMDPETTLPQYDPNISDEENVQALQNAYARIVGHEMKGGIPKGTDPRSLRERLVEMLRMQQSFPKLRKRITTFGEESEGSMSTRTQFRPDAAYDVSFNPAREQAVNEWKYIDPENPGDLTPEQVKENNIRWYNSQVRDRVRFLTAAPRFAGTHEQGHIISDMVRNDAVAKHIQNLGLPQTPGSREHEATSLRAYARGEVTADIINAALWKAMLKEAKIRKNGGKIKEKGSYIDFLGKFGQADARTGKAAVDLGDNMSRLNYGPGKELRGIDADISVKARKQIREEAQQALDNGEQSDMAKFLKLVPTAQMPAEAPAQAPAQEPPGGYRKHWWEFWKPKAESRSQPAEPSNTGPALSRAEQARMALYQMGAISRYGAVKPEEMMAEAMAEVSAHGKDSSLFSHYVYKIHWALNNPEAAERKKQRKAARQAQNGQGTPPAAP